MYNKKIVYTIVGVVVIGVLFLIFNQTPFFQPLGVPTPQTPVSPSGATAITKAVTSRSIDAKGNATGETAAFNAKTDKIVYVVLTLQNAAKTTKVSYTRYLNGKYIDSKVAQPSKDGMTNFYFTFEKGIGDYPKGTYTVKLYVDGRRATNLTYVFK